VDDGGARREDDRLAALAPGKAIPFGGDRVAYVSPELAAGIRRVKGAKRVGVRLGNGLSLEQSRTLLRAPDADSLKGRRDGAILALLLGCGLRRSEVVERGL